MENRKVIFGPFDAYFSVFTVKTLEVIYSQTNSPSPREFVTKTGEVMIYVFYNPSAKELLEFRQSPKLMHTLCYLAVQKMFP